MWLIFLIYFAACLHEAFGPFVIGHDGFNGAAFSQAARNSLRFGIPQQVQYYTDFATPPLSDVYTNHPLLLHVQLTALLGLGGVEPWIARLLPIAYALGFFVLLYRVTARRAGPLTATIAITLWTLTPLHTIFANMVNHEQGGLFWCFLLVDRYLLYQSNIAARLTLDGPASRVPARQWPIFLAISCAMQFDWVGYYFAFFIGLHALVRALRVHDGRSLLRRLGFTLRFSGVVLFNVALFFGWIAWLRGGLSEMGAAFTQRSHSPAGYLKLVFERSTDLYGLGFMALLGIWLVYATVRVFRRRATAIDLIPWTFFGAQLIHSVVFKSAGAIHSYWTIYAGPALAVGGAMVLVAGATVVGRWFMRSGHPTHASTLVPVVLLMVGATAQANYALGQHLWGHDNHRASYLDYTNDEWAESQWSILLHKRFGRDGTCYLVHPSADRTVQVMYYLDAQRRDGKRALLSPSFRATTDLACEREILLVDRTRINAQEAERLPELIQEHPTIVLDRRFVAVIFKDGRKPTAGSPEDFEAWLMAPRPAPWWWSWLVSTRNPPFVIEEDPDRDWLLAEGIAEWHGGSTPGWAGGSGGTHQELTCPPGAFVHAIDVHVDNETVSGIGVECAVVPGALETVESLDGGADDSAMCVPGLFTGTYAAHRHSVIACPEEARMTGLRGRAAALVDALGPLCQAISELSGARKNQRTTLLARTARIEGGPGGQRFDLPCQPDERLIGVTVRAGALVDALSAVCAPAPAVSLP